jgi:(4-O-methyl)-D-glucuronate---lignin esterase
MFNHHRTRVILTLRLIKLSLAAAIMFAILPGHALFAADLLQDGFCNPPDSARPWVYWFIMDGNLGHAGITPDLEAMREAGIGGALVMEVNVGIPRGPVEFMGAAWRDSFKFAVEEAERLGLELALNAGPGWTGSGGPWVKAEQSMQHLVASATEVIGPARFDAVLPVPKPRPPYFGTEGLPQEIIQARNEFYQDVVVLAVPRGDGSRLEDIDEKALYVRAPYTSRPGVKPYLPALASYPEHAASAILPLERVLDLTERMQPDGGLVWDPPAGDWTLLRFGSRNTGANTRPAPLPGLGFECDKFDPAALDAHYDAFVGKLLRAIGPRPTDRKTGWTMLHIDSWEMGSQNWTANFREEFERRRGYDLLPYLPVMTGRIMASAEISERFLWDLRLTAQELVIENHAGHLKKLGRENGFSLSIEPYDMNPTSDMVLGGVADVPMCEFWSKGYGFDSDFTLFESASVAHTQGKPIVAAEAFTADASEAWRLYPANMKNQGDWALCAGVNRFVFHRFAHQRWPDRRPGMTMGPYGVHWDRTQTWWPLASAYHRYLARCQFMLRQGAAVADICYLIPEGAPHVFRPPVSAFKGELRDRRGYNFDGCAPETLLANASVQDGRIIFSGGAEYTLLVLPSFATMTPRLLRKIKELAESGATVAGPPPRKSPSLSAYPQCDEEVRAIATELWGGLKIPAMVNKCRAGKGNIVWGGNMESRGGRPAATELAEGGVPPKNLDQAVATVPELYPDYEATAQVLSDMGLPPDFTADGPVRYTHRRTAEADIYFIANQSAGRLDATCAFRVVGRQPQLWDPVTGEIRALPLVAKTGKRTLIPLRFESHQSFFVIFRSHSDKIEGDKNYADVSSVATINGAWDVTFDPSLGGPESAAFADLLDWSRHPDPEIKYYSGIATYKKRFDLPHAFSTGAPILLDLGEVHSMARVRVNGHDLGILWCAPWRVDITDVAQARNNRLEIEIANLWPNRLIGDSDLPADQRIAWTTWSPYQPDSPLLPSGLLGPVRIMTSE